MSARDWTLTVWGVVGIGVVICLVATVLCLILIRQKDFEASAAPGRSSGEHVSVAVG